MVRTSPYLLALLASALGVVAKARNGVAAVRDARSNVPTPTPTPTRTVSQPGCPSAIGLKNGGFESGSIAPWAALSNSDANTTQARVVSPGYRSSHALQLAFAPKDPILEYSLAQQTTGKECYGYYYTISYAWNWLHYSGPEGNGSTYCRIDVGTGYCDNDVEHYATRTPGWHAHSYRCRNIYSCRPAYADYNLGVTCDGGSGPVPDFTLLVDSFSIQTAPGSPTPLPTGPCF